MMDEGEVMRGGRGMRYEEDEVRRRRGKELRSGTQRSLVRKVVGVLRGLRCLRRRFVGDGELP